MKLLLDTCVSRGAQAELVSAGHDIVHNSTMASFRQLRPVVGNPFHYPV